MDSGMKLVTFLLIAIAIAICLVRGDAPVVTSYGSSYLPPAQPQEPYSHSHYSVPSQYGSPVSGGYASPSTAKPTYGVPAPSYGPPSSSYGPQGSAGYDSLRDFATAPESAFIQRRLFNTSVALTVPLFSFTLPQRASQGSTVDLANQAIFGLFSLLVVVLIFAVPILFTGSRPPLTGRSNDDRNGILNHLMTSNKVFNFMGADLTNNIGLDTTKCLQKTICEAHKFSKKYGMMATPFQVFFPAPANGTSEAKASMFQLAARAGKSKKDCGKEYKCFFDILDLCDYFMDWWKMSTNSNYVTEM